MKNFISKRVFLAAMLSGLIPLFATANEAPVDVAPSEKKVDIVALRAQSQANVLAEIDRQVERSTTFIKEQLSDLKSAGERFRYEYMMRSVYENDLMKLRTRLLRSQRLTNPAVEVLKEERSALLKKLEALEERIVVASEETPEIQVLDYQRAQNELRLQELREILTPPEERKTSKENNPTTP